mgnify:CR=1 FL=1|jgi:hypothetical protein
MDLQILGATIYCCVIELLLVTRPAIRLFNHSPPVNTAFFSGSVFLFIWLRICDLKYLFLLSIYFLQIHASSAESVGNMRVIAISVADDTAILRLPSSEELSVLQTGDFVTPSYLIEQIYADRVALRDQSETSTRGDLYWVFLAKPGESSRIQNLSNIAPRRAVNGAIQMTIAPKK